MTQRQKRKSSFVLRLIAYGLILLLAVLFTLPHFVSARWVSCGVPITLKFTVVDAQTHEPVSGARVLIGEDPHWNWAIISGSRGDYSAATDAGGNCEAQGYFPGSGTRDRTRLRVVAEVCVLAEGYEAWQQPCTALLGRHLHFIPTSQPLSARAEIKLNRKQH